MTSGEGGGGGGGTAEDIILGVEAQGLEMLSQGERQLPYAPRLVEEMRACKTRVFQLIRSASEPEGAPRSLSLDAPSLCLSLHALS